MKRLNTILIILLLSCGGSGDPSCPNPNRIEEPNQFYLDIWTILETCVNEERNAQIGEIGIFKSAAEPPIIGFVDYKFDCGKKKKVNGCVCGDGFILVIEPSQKVAVSLIIHEFTHVMMRRIWWKDPNHQTPNIWEKGNNPLSMSCEGQAQLFAEEVINE